MSATQYNIAITVGLMLVVFGVVSEFGIARACIVGGGLVLIITLIGALAVRRI